MHAALDVHYTNTASSAACLAFRDWTDHQPAQEWHIDPPPAPNYQPGEFYRRELEPLLAVLDAGGHQFETLIIDGYCQLDAAGSPGLGAHLHTAIGNPPPVIGVAKNRYRDRTHAAEVLRGGSARPLFVTSAGMPLEEAARRIESMHGPDRIPILLKAVDRLARSGGPGRGASGSAPLRRNE